MITLELSIGPTLLTLGLALGAFFAGVAVGRRSKIVTLIDSRIGQFIDYLGRSKSNKVEPVRPLPPTPEE